MKYSNEELLRMYTGMVRSRVYEEHTLDLHSDGKLDSGSWHMAIGEEATQIGAICALGPDDYYSSTHRCHGVMAVKLDPRKFTAECLCRSTGYSRGKCASVHINSLEEHVLPSNGILGANAAIGTGFAWALKRQGKKGVVVSTIGDSASAEGNFYESLNLAAITGAPIVFFIENNGIGEMTPIESSTHLKDLSQKGVIAAIPGVTVDGTDIIAVREAVETAIEMAQNGQPSIVEAKMNRYRCHSEGGFPEPFMDAKIAEAKKHDPIDKFEKTLREMGLLDDAKVNEIHDEALAIAKDAYEFALSSPYGDADAYTNMDLVYKCNGGDME